MLCLAFGTVLEDTASSGKCRNCKLGRVAGVMQRAITLGTLSMGDAAFGKRSGVSRNFKRPTLANCFNGIQSGVLTATHAASALCREAGISLDGIHGALRRHLSINCGLCSAYPSCTVCATTFVRLRGAWEMKEERRASHPYGIARFFKEIREDCREHSSTSRHRVLPQRKILISGTCRASRQPQYQEHHHQLPYLVCCSEAECSHETLQSAVVRSAGLAPLPRTLRRSACTAPAHLHEG